MALRDVNGEGDGKTEPAGSGAESQPTEALRAACGRLVEGAHGEEAPALRPRGLRLLLRQLGAPRLTLSCAVGSHHVLVRKVSQKQAAQEGGGCSGPAARGAHPGIHVGHPRCFEKERHEPRGARQWTVWGSVRGF